MKYAKLVSIIFLLVFIGNTSAAVLYWHHSGFIGGSDVSQWSDPNNWGVAGTGLPAAPGPSDHALIHNYDNTWPIIDSDVGTVNIVTPAWHGVHAEMTMTTGGYMYVSGFMRLGDAAGAMGVLNFTGGGAGGKYSASGLEW